MIRSIIRQLLWAMTAIGSIIGALILTAGLLTAKGAPQQAAAASIALCWAVLPYVFARAVDEVNRA